MKIASVEVYPLKAAVQAYAASVSVAPFSGRRDLLVRVVSDDGLDGWGETGLVQIATFAAGVQEVLAPTLIGQDPCAPLTRLAQMQHALRSWKTGLARAVGAIDTALWDLKGKAEGRPISSYFGAESVGRYPAVGEAVFYDPAAPGSLDRRLRQAEEWAAKGFRGIKLKIGGLTPREDLEHVRAISKALGPETMVCVDANAAYSLPTARHVCERLADLGVYWFEEPIPLDNFSGYAELASHSRGVVIAGGQSLPSPESFLPLFEARGLHLVQNSVSSVGGFSESVRLLGIARAFGVRWSPHHAGTGIFTAAALHLRAIAARSFQSPFPDLDWLEWDMTPNPLTAVVKNPPLPDKEGLIAVPTGPGLGVEIDLALVRRMVG